MSKERIFVREYLLPGILSGIHKTKNITNYLPISRTKLAQDFYGTDGTLAGTIIKYDNKIYIHYYGTKNTREALSDLNITSASIKYNNQDIYVHAGFHNVYKTSKDNMLKAIKELDQDPSLPVGPVRKCA